MKLSIVMPVYNTNSDALRFCVESVVGQTCADWNLIMVDDGSAPETASLCDEIAQSDSRITVIHQKNAGAGAARNAGTQYADGEYVAYIDSDDVLSPYMVEDALDAVKETGADIVYGMVYQSRDLNKILRVINDYHSKRINSPCDKETVMRWLVYAKSWEYQKKVPAFVGKGPVNRAVKREIALKTSFSSDKIGEDGVWNFRLLAFSEKLVLNWNVWYGYITRDNSTVRKYYGNRLQEAENFIATLRKENPDFFRENPAALGWLLAGNFYPVAKFDIAPPESPLAPNRKNRELREILKRPPWNLLTRKEYRERLLFSQKIFILASQLGFGHSLLSLYLRAESLRHCAAGIFKRSAKHGDV